MKEFNVEEFLKERKILIDNLTHYDALLLAIDEAYRMGYHQCLSELIEYDKHLRETTSIMDWQPYSKNLLPDLGRKIQVRLKGKQEHIYDDQTPENVHNFVFKYGESKLLWWRYVS